MRLLTLLAALPAFFGGQARRRFRRLGPGGLLALRLLILRLLALLPTLLGGALLLGLRFDRFGLILLRLLFLRLQPLATPLTPGSSVIGGLCLLGLLALLWLLLLLLPLQTILALLAAFLAIGWAFFALWASRVRLRELQHRS